jgi:DNA end-binding protein Ku
MLDLAGHIIDTMSGHFEPEKFDDRYEDALREVIKRKAAGEKIVPIEHARPKTTVNLMEALRASIASTERRPPAPSTPHRAPAAARKPGTRAKPRPKAEGREPGAGRG